MPAPEGTPLYLQIAWENAWSVPPGEKPRGEYIGEIKTEYEIFYFYQENDKYWFETEYTRQQAERKKREGEPLEAWALWLRLRSKMIQINTGVIARKMRCKNWKTIWFTYAAHTEEI